MFISIAKSLTNIREKLSIRMGCQLILASLYFSTNVLFAHAAETNFWSERKAQAASQINHESDLAQLIAGPPALTTRLSGNAFFGRAPLLSKSMAVPAQFGSSRHVLRAESNKRGTIVHIQDVHENLEAQQNIAGILKSLGSNVDLLALEGRDGNIDLQAFRDYPHRDVIQNVADYLLSQGQISGPIHWGLTQQSKVRVVGVDDSALHAANVEAYKNSLPNTADVAQQIESESARLKGRAKETFNSRLSVFQQNILDYQEDRISLNDHISQISQHTSSLSSTLRRFIQASVLEKSIDFTKLKTERDHLLAKVTSALSPNDQRQLVQISLQYRKGALSHKAFLQFLETLCQSHSISLKNYPQMLSYISYINLVDDLDGEQLYRDITSAEQSILATIIQTPKEQRLVDEIAQLTLTKKLSHFSLTRDEWARYEALKKSTEVALPVAPFEDFYRCAVQRDEAMASNLLKVLQKSDGATVRQSDGRTVARSDCRTVVLVTGGFHTQGLERKLVKAGWDVVSVVPRLTKVEEDASKSLTVFTQQKTPLEEYVSGQRLFLSADPWRAALRTAILAAGAAAWLKISTAKVALAQFMKPSAPWIIKENTSIDSASLSIEIPETQQTFSIQTRFTGNQKKWEVSSYSDQTSYAMSLRGVVGLFTVLTSLVLASFWIDTNHIQLPLMAWGMIGAPAFVASSLLFTVSFFALFRTSPVAPQTLRPVFGISDVRVAPISFLQMRKDEAGHKYVAVNPMLARLLNHNKVAVRAATTLWLHLVGAGGHEVHHLAHLDGDKQDSWLTHSWKETKTFFLYQGVPPLIGFAIAYPSAGLLGSFEAKTDSRDQLFGFYFLKVKGNWYVLNEDGQAIESKTKFEQKDDDHLLVTVPTEEFPPGDITEMHVQAGEQQNWIHMNDGNVRFTAEFYSYTALGMASLLPVGAMGLTSRGKTMSSENELSGLSPKTKGNIRSFLLSNLEFVFHVPMLYALNQTMPSMVWIVGIPMAIYTALLFAIVAHPFYSKSQKLVAGTVGLGLGLFIVALHAAGWDGNASLFFSQMAHNVYNLLAFRFDWTRASVAEGLRKSDGSNNPPWANLEMNVHLMQVTAFQKQLDELIEALGGKTKNIIVVFPIDGIGQLPEEMKKQLFTANLEHAQDKLRMYLDNIAQIADNNSNEMMMRYIREDNPLTVQEHVRLLSIPLLPSDMEIVKSANQQKRSPHIELMASADSQIGAYLKTCANPRETFDTYRRVLWLHTIGLGNSFLNYLAEKEKQGYRFTITYENQHAPNRKIVPPVAYFHRKVMSIDSAMNALLKGNVDNYVRHQSNYFTDEMLMAESRDALREVSLDLMKQAGVTNPILFFNTDLRKRSARAIPPNHLGQITLNPSEDWLETPIMWILNRWKKDEKQQSPEVKEELIRFGIYRILYEGLLQTDLERGVQLSQALTKCLREIPVKDFHKMIGRLKNSKEAALTVSDAATRVMQMLSERNDPQTALYMAEICKIVGRPISDFSANHLREWKNPNLWTSEADVKDDMGTVLQEKQTKGLWGHMASRLSSVGFASTEELKAFLFQLPWMTETIWQSLNLIIPTSTDLPRHSILSVSDDLADISGVASALNILRAELTPAPEKTTVVIRQPSTRMDDPDFMRRVMNDNFLQDELLNKNAEKWMWTAAQSIEEFERLWNSKEIDFKFLMRVCEMVEDPVIFEMLSRHRKRITAPDLAATILNEAKRMSSKDRRLLDYLTGSDNQPLSKEVLMVRCRLLYTVSTIMFSSQQLSILRHTSTHGNWSPIRMERPDKVAFLLENRFLIALQKAKDALAKGDLPTYENYLALAVDSYSRGIETRNRLLYQRLIPQILQSTGEPLVVIDTDDYRYHRAKIGVPDAQREYTDPASYLDPLRPIDVAARRWRVGIPLVGQDPDVQLYFARQWIYYLLQPLAGLWAGDVKFLTLLGELTREVDMTMAGILKNLLKVKVTDYEKAERTLYWLVTHQNKNVVALVEKLIQLVGKQNDPRLILVNKAKSQPLLANPSRLSVSEKIRWAEQAFPDRNQQINFLLELSHDSETAEDAIELDLALMAFYAQDGSLTEAHDHLESAARYLNEVMAEGEASPRILGLQLQLGLALLDKNYPVLATARSEHPQWAQAVHHVARATAMEELHHDQEALREFDSARRLLDQLLTKPDPQLIQLYKFTLTHKARLHAKGHDFRNALETLSDGNRSGKLKISPLFAETPETVLFFARTLGDYGYAQKGLEICASLPGSLDKALAVIRLNYQNGAADLSYFVGVAKPFVKTTADKIKFTRELYDIKQDYAAIDTLTEVIDSRRKLRKEFAEETAARILWAEHNPDLKEAFESLMSNLILDAQRLSTIDEPDRVLHTPEAYLLATNLLIKRAAVAEKKGTKDALLRQALSFLSADDGDSLKWLLKNTPAAGRLLFRVLILRGQTDKAQAFREALPENHPERIMAKVDQLLMKNGGIPTALVSKELVRFIDQDQVEMIPSLASDEEAVIIAAHSLVWQSPRQSIALLCKPGTLSSKEPVLKTFLASNAKANKILHQALDRRDSVAKKSFEAGYGINSVITALVVVLLIGSLIVFSPVMPFIGSIVKEWASTAVIVAGVIVMIKLILSNLNKHVRFYVWLTGDDVAKLTAKIQSQLRRSTTPQVFVLEGGTALEAQLLQNPALAKAQQEGRLYFEIPNINAGDLIVSLQKKGLPSDNIDNHFFMIPTGANIPDGYFDLSKSSLPALLKIALQSRLQKVFITASAIPLIVDLTQGIYRDWQRVKLALSHA